MTGKSEGEVMRFSVGQVNQQPIQQVYYDREYEHDMPQRSKSPKPSRSQRTRSPAVREYRSPDSPKKGSPQKPSQFSSYRAQSPTRVSFEGLHHISHIHSYCCGALFKNIKNCVFHILDIEFD